VGPKEKYVFISYVREDADKVDKLSARLRAASIPVWTDRTQLAPGDDWKAKIRQAIQSGSIAFLACFSDHSRGRNSSVQNEEITLAVDEFRKRAPGQTWLIPIRFDDGEVPEWDLGAGRTLGNLHYADLFGDLYDEHVIQLIVRIQDVTGIIRLEPATRRAAIEQAADAERPALLQGATTEMLLEEKRKIELDALIAQETTGILTAMRDLDRFPTALANGTNEEQIIQVVTAASELWRLVEPFCWSLQVAARWAPTPASLRPWTNALRSLCTEAGVVTGGHQILYELRYIPALTATFVAALASAGQHRWDNFKTLLVDTTVPAPRYQQQKVSVIEAVDPYKPFTVSDWAPNVLARSAIEDEAFDAALTAFEGKPPAVGKYKTPTAEWLHHILRPAFDIQFPDDGDYDREFDRTEVMLGIVGQDQATLHAQKAPDVAWLFRSRWFGRSTWRAPRDRHGNPVEDIAEEIALHEAAWEPLAAGLFGESMERASDAVSKYRELFGQSRW
jgi:hypothetical protein